MRGYIAITNPIWFDFQKNHKFEIVNFMRKNTSAFKVLQPGDHFFFLVKNRLGDRSERVVRGYGIYQSFEVLELEEAWLKYEHANGWNSKTEYANDLQNILEVDSSKGMGCIILSDLHFFNKPVLLSEIGIEFQKSIVSGKGIDEFEVERILESSGDAFSYFPTLEEQEFPEGRIKYVTHQRLERNKKLIDLAKQKFIEKNGSLHCEVCGFNFETKYGEIGEDYIEAHHSLPISEMKENHKTKVEELVMVCANCHRMLHRRRPWLNKDELSLLIKLDH